MNKEDVYAFILFLVVVAILVTGIVFVHNLQVAEGKAREAALTAFVVGEKAEIAEYQRVPDNINVDCSVFIIYAPVVANHPTVRASR